MRYDRSQAKHHWLFQSLESSLHDSLKRSVWAEPSVSYGVDTGDVGSSAHLPPPHGGERPAEDIHH